MAVSILRSNKESVFSLFSFQICCLKFGPTQRAHFERYKGSPLSESLSIDSMIVRNFKSHYVIFFKMLFFYRLVHLLWLQLFQYKLAALKQTNLTQKCSHAFFTIFAKERNWRSRPLSFANSISHNVGLTLTASAKLFFQLFFKLATGSSLIKREVSVRPLCRV